MAGRLAQADGTAWMAMYCLNLLEIALVLAEHDRVYEDMATKFLEHFAYIATASEALWDEEGGFYHDVLHRPTATGSRYGSDRSSDSSPSLPRRRWGRPRWSACPTSPVASAGSRPTSPSSPPA